VLPDLPAPLPADLVARRPDLQAAERRLASARLGVGQSQANLYPRLSLTAAGGTVSRQLRDLLSGDFGVWNLIGNVTQPLFQGGSYVQPLLIMSAIPFGLVGAVWGHYFMGLESFRWLSSRPAIWFWRT
jgi:outer membrane protein TolC